MEKEYYIVVDDRRVGPLTFDGLRQHGITPDTLVWTAGMSDWAKASTLDELQSLLYPGAGIDEEESAFGSYSRDYNTPPRNEHPDYSRPNCGNSYPTGPNWKTLSIVACICGFLFSCIGGIIGIFAILEANKAENAARYGDDRSAANNWANCKTLTIISFVIAGIAVIAQIGMLSTGLMTFGAYL